jgi:glycosyltransferase involved in cell wall biosynthesis
MQMKKSVSKRVVCFVAPLAYGLFNPKSKTVFGGAEVQLFQIGKQLSSSDHYEVHFVVVNEGQKSPARFGNVTVHASYSLAKNPINYLLAPLKLYGTLRRISPDVVVQRGAGAETGICGVYCKWNRKKFVFSVAHEIDVNGTFAGRGVIGKLYSIGLVRADEIIIQNEDQKLMLKKWRGAIANRATLIRTGYPQRDRAPSGKKFVLWVARSDSWKQPLIFVDLARAFPKTDFVMIMPKSSDVKTWQAVMERSKSIRNLRIIDKVPFAEVQNYFDRATVFVNTSVHEGFPNTFIQSCLGSTPILSLSVNPAAFIEKAGCGYFADGNITLLHKQLGSLLGSKTLRATLGRQGAAYAKKNYDIANVVREWEKLL